MFNNFSIIIPVLNEAENIREILSEIEKFFIAPNHIKNNDYEIIIVDDGSSDNIVDILNNYKTNLNYKIIFHSINLGQSASILTGIKNSNYDIIITLDGDGQNNPKDIFKLLLAYNEIDNISLVGGIRTKRKDNFIKRKTSTIANMVRSYILEDNCIDSGCGLKIFSKIVFLELPYFNGIHRFLPALFQGFGYRTLFLEVDHRYRIKGFSKYGTFKRLIKGISDLIRVRKIIYQKKLK